MTEVYEAALSDSTLSDAHRSFAEIALPASSLSGGTDMVVAAESEEEQPLFKRLAAHVLSPACDLFGGLQKLLTAVTVRPSRGRGGKGRGAPDPNALGYLVTGRNLMSCLPLLLRLPYLGSSQLRSAIETFALIFRLDTTYALAEDFWSSAMRTATDADEDESMDMKADEVPLARAEREYLEVAKTRFPTSLGPFVTLIRSLSGVAPLLAATPDDTTVRSTQEACAVSTLKFLGDLQSLTFALPPTPMLVPLPYEPIASDQAGESLVQAVRPISVSPSVTIPTGTVGSFLSGAGQKPVIVCWKVEWSAWALFGDIIEECSRVRQRARRRSGQGTELAGEVFDDNGPEEGQPIDPAWAADQLDFATVSSILEVLAAVVNGINTQESRLQLVDELSSDRPPDETVQAIFALLERSVVGSHDLQADLAQASLRLIGSLISVFPADVWTMLRGSRFLFPALSESKVWRQAESSASILQREKLTGTYTVTLAILDVILVLWEHCRLMSLSSDRGSTQISVEVLLRALAWVRDEVWPGLPTWKYARLEDKFLLAFKCALIFSSVGREAMHCAATGKRKDAVCHAAFDFFKASFVSQASVTTLNTVVYLLSATTTTVSALEADGRLSDAEALMCAIDATLELAESALSLRPSVLGDRPCLLERLFLASSAKDEVASALHALSHWCLLPGLTAPTARRVFTLLCTLAKDWPSDWPSVISSFGDSERAMLFVDRMLERATGGDPKAEREAAGDATAWQLLAAALETQPAIALRLVGDTTQTSRGGDDRTAESALKASMAYVIAHKGKLANGDNVVCVALAFLETVVQRAGEFKHVLAGPAKDDQLSNALTEIATASVPTPDLDVHTGIDESADRTVAAACVHALGRAYAARTLAMLVQIAAPERSSADCATASVKALRHALTTSTARFSEVLVGAMASAADPDLQRDAVAHLESAVDALDLEEYRDVPSVLPHDRIWRYGRSFVYDFETVMDRLQVASSAVEQASLSTLR